MATLQNQDQNNPQNPTNQPMTGGAGGAGAATGTGAAGTSQVQQNTAPQSGSGYVDVSSYLNANQQGGQDLGQKVASNLTNTYNTTMGDINTSAQGATKAANTGYVPENTQLIQQVAANPTAAVSNPDLVSGFQGQLNNTYTGPSNWADYGTLQGKVSQAQQTGNLINTPGGANVLTQQVEQQLNPGQTGQGINALDTLLLMGNPNAVQSVQTAATPFQGLGTYLDTQNTGVTNAIDTGRTNAAQSAQDALSAFTGGNGTLTNLNTTLNTAGNTALTNAQSQYAQVQQDFSNAAASGDWSKVSPTTIQALGLTPEQWKGLSDAQKWVATSEWVGSSNPGNGSAWSPTTNVDLSQYLSGAAPTASAYNAGTVATPEQYAEMAAINQLLGTKAPLQGEAINPLNASLAATAPKNVANFSYDPARAALSQLGGQERITGQQMADEVAARQEAEHQASKGGGLFGGVTDFLKNYAINPLSVVPKEINTVKSKLGK